VPAILIFQQKQQNTMTTPKKILFSTAAALLLVSATFAQKQFTLKGQVLDQKRNEPLMAVAVAIKGKAVGTATDLDGKFSFKIAETYLADTLVVSMLGYEPYKLPIAAAQTLTGTELQIFLSEAAFDLLTVEVGAPIILNNIFFQFNEHELLPSSFPELEKLYNFLKKNENVLVEIAGHTDSIGSAAYNAALSEARASAVVNYLEKKGISQSRMTAKGYGKVQPVVSNATERGRALNRRVTFTVLSKGEIVNKSQMPENLNFSKDTSSNPIVLIPPTVVKLENKPKPTPPTTADKTDALSEILAFYSIQKGFNGAVAIFQNGKMTYKGSWGFADLNNILPNTANTQFYIGTITEQFTAALVLKAVKNNQLNLTATLETYLPDVPKKIANKVTIQQLLTHTSGICNVPFTSVANLELCFVPNQARNYSAANYILLGKILEKIHKKGIVQIFEQEIISRLQLNHTKVLKPSFAAGDLAKSYRQAGSRLELTQRRPEVFNETAANGIISNAEDLVKWQRALKNKDFLAADMQLIMETISTGTEAIGARVQQVVLGDKVLPALFSEERYFGHNTLVIRGLSNDLTLCITTNVETFETQALYRDLLKSIYEIK
jgi:outer membrane protein OmpA-like peptidoglycan-associated protein/CubicO group peptidase (beta-lactamase class C family)